MLTRRYELPTCVLEIWTERSPLSEWQSQIVAQNLHFRLQLSYSKKIIKGNQQQITNLIEAVTTYCDRWLAQDDFDSLNHAIEVPKLLKLKLSTLQLYDLYESLELCADEFAILPNLVLEVRHFSPNWLKIIASAIAIVGLSIGTIRLIYREQPSYQIASTPAASYPEVAFKKDSISPSNSPLDNKSLSSSKDTSDTSKDASKDISKDTAKIISSSNSVSTKADTKETTNAPMPLPTQSVNGEKPQTNMDKVAIAPKPSSNAPQRQRQADSIPSDSATVNMPSSPNMGTLRQDAPRPNTAEIAKPSAKTSQVENANIATANIKVLEIQSELPAKIVSDLVRYLQSQRIDAKGTIALFLDISGDQIGSISINRQNSTLTDPKAIAELEKIILNWRSPNSVTGKIYLILQL